MYNETWGDIDPDLSAQDQYDKFDAKISKHYNSAFPIKSNTNRRGFCPGLRMRANASKSCSTNLQKIIRHRTKSNTNV